MTGTGKEQKKVIGKETGNQHEKKKEREKNGKEGTEGIEAQYPTSIPAEFLGNLVFKIKFGPI